MRSAITGIAGKVLGCYRVHENAGQGNAANDEKDDFLFYSITDDKIISSLTEQDIGSIIRVFIRLHENGLGMVLLIIRARKAVLILCHLPTRPML